MPPRPPPRGTGGGRGGGARAVAHSGLLHRFTLHDPQVVPVGSEGLKSLLATVPNVAGMSGATTAITLVAVAALLSALNANQYGASRMAFSLAERLKRCACLPSCPKARVPVAAVLPRTMWRPPGW